MKLDGDVALGHLTYCTNIHAGETWPEVLSALQRYLPEIKSGFAPQAPMGVGLRLSAAAAEALQKPAARAELHDLLDGAACYVFTINGFPYGAFHGQKVKEGAYRPDWSDPARLHYSNALARLLASLLPDGIDGSVSTVPGTYKPWANGGAIDAIVENLLQHAAELVTLERDTGKTIALALEPEPCCLLETIAETVAFFQQRLYSSQSVARLAKLTGFDSNAAEQALRRHLGVCYDVCHAAVEFENARESIAGLRAAGIPVAKLQLSCALKVANVTPAAVDELRAFDEPVYLHQVVEKPADGRLRRYTDLGEAIANAHTAGGAEWRIHFHVPIFERELKRFATTQEFLREILALHHQAPISEHLEVETYTWDVLPERHRRIGMGAAIARELNWVKDQLC
ncbi:MAG: metabolite traffic protein EboE [Gammaproteobacteria bacterium]|nr:metabolite traffic protein EboE [Gammaproteobacteria bacterium]